MQSYVSKICKFCGNEFLALNCEVKRGRGIYCSRICGNRGKAADRENPNHRQEWLDRTIGTPMYQKKKRVHHIVEYAIRSGRLIRKPCEICGSEPSEAHHDDYDKPLEVRWLCRSHHMKLERNKK